MWGSLAQPVQEVMPETPAPWLAARRTSAPPTAAGTALAPLGAPAPLSQRSLPPPAQFPAQQWASAPVSVGQPSWPAQWAAQPALQWQALAAPAVLVTQPEVMAAYGAGRPGDIGPTAPVGVVAAIGEAASASALGWALAGVLLALATRRRG